MALHHLLYQMPKHLTALFHYALSGGTLSRCTLGLMAASTVFLFLAFRFRLTVLSRCSALPFGASPSPSLPSVSLGPLPVLKYSAFCGFLSCFPISHPPLHTGTHISLLSFLRSLFASSRFANAVALRCQFIPASGGLLLGVPVLPFTSVRLASQRLFRTLRPAFRFSPFSIVKTLGKVTQLGDTP